MTSHYGISYHILIQWDIINGAVLSNNKWQSFALHCAPIVHIDAYIYFIKMTQSLIKTKEKRKKNENKTNTMEQ